MSEPFPSPFPWIAVMRFGLGTLQLPPAAFWSMTMRELNAALEAHSGIGEATPDRGWLDTAMSRFPDKQG